VIYHELLRITVANVILFITFCKIFKRSIRNKDKYKQSLMNKLYACKNDKTLQSLYQLVT